MGKNFVEVFHDAITQVEVDAKKVGLNLTSICRDLGVSRATPDRWRKTIPMTIDLLAKMQEMIKARAKETGKTLD